MKKGKLIGKVFGIALVFVMIGAMLSGLPGITKAANKFNIGDIAEVYNTGTSGLLVLNAPCGSVIGGKFDGDRGVVLSGPVYCYGYNRWEIRWENGLEGWSAEDWLRVKYIAPSTKFSINDEVGVINAGAIGINIRTDPPELAKTGTKAFDGDTGTVLGGPFYGVPQGSSGFYYFWKVDFGSIVGWIAEGDATEDWLVALPDLIVEDIWTDPVEFKPGAAVKVYIRIKNMGDGDAVSYKGLHIKGYFDGSMCYEEGIEGLGAGWDTGDALYWTQTWPSDTNTHTITARVDPDNFIPESEEGNNEKSEAFSATPNQLPTAYIDSITPNPATQGTHTVSFTGHGADSDGSVVAWSWRSSRDGQLSTSSSFNKPASALSVGTHTIYFKVMDDDGAWSTEDTETLTINPAPTPNQLPTAYIDSITPNPATQGTHTVSFTGHGTDSDGIVVAYNWRSSRDGQLSTSSSFNMPASALSVGTHTIYFKVMDNDDAWSTEATSTLTINPAPTPNQLPTAYIDSITPNPATQGTHTVSFTGHGADSDGSVVAWSWRSSRDGQLSTSSSFNKPASALSVGTHTIYFKVMDDDGAWSTEDTETLTINPAPTPNQPPTAYIDSITLNPATQGTHTVSFTGHGADSDGSVVAWSWRSSRDGQLSTSASFNKPASALFVGTHTIYFKVMDDDGAWSTEDTETLTINPAPTPNQPPVASFNYIPQSPVRSGDYVEFSAQGSFDPDSPNGAISKYTWDFGDGTIESGNEKVTVVHRFRGASHGNSKTYDISLTVEDTYGATDKITSQIHVLPLSKTIEVTKIPNTPLTVQVSARLTVWYNWVDEVNEENIYVVSKAKAKSDGWIGYYSYFIEDAHSSNEPVVVWWDLLSSFMNETYYGCFTGPTYFPDFSRLLQKWQPKECDDFWYGDDVFEGFLVYGSDVIRLRAIGIPAGVSFGTNPAVIAIQALAQGFAAEDTTCFDPEGGFEPPGWGGIDYPLWGSTLCSPGELIVYDTEGRITGVINGDIVEEIPNSICTGNEILISSAYDSYTIKIVGTYNDLYGLSTAFLTNGNEATTFEATDIPITSTQIHQYTFDWDALSEGEESVTVQTDSNGDGVFENKFTSDEELTQDEFRSQFPGCFIATSAYGTPMAKEIQILRDFRDEYLLTNLLGQALVDFYYRVSPPIAEFITEHPSLKPIVRTGLVPAVAMTTVVVNTTPAEKIAVVSVMVLVSVALAVWARRRRGRGPEYS